MIDKTLKHAAGFICATVSSFVWAVGEDTGTSAVAEMDVSGSHLLMLVGGVAVVGIVLWLVVRLMNR